MPTFWTNLSVMGTDASVIVTADDANGTIVAIGDEQLLTEKSRDDRLVDLEGGVATAGLWDSHVHLLEYGRSLRRLRFGATESRHEVLHRVRDGAQLCRPGEWIVGHGFNREVFDMAPDMGQLDRVAPHHPVALISLDHHTVWINGLAYQRIGGTGDDIPGMDYDSHGQFTGIIHEKGAFWVQDLLASLDDPRSEEDLKTAIREAHRFGMVGVTTIEGHTGWNALQRMREEDRTIRVQVFVIEDLAKTMADRGIRAGYGNDKLRLMGVKLFMDGALGSKTAWMTEPYASDPQNRGQSLMTSEQLERWLRELSDAGLLAAVHAIGDQAVHELVSALARITPTTEMLSRIEHAQLIRDDDLERLTSLSVALSMQPAHLLVDRPIADRLWGDRAQRAFRFRDIVTANIPLVFGSDGPIVTMDPALGLWAAVHGAEGEDPAWHPHQVLTPQEAFDAYTATPAQIDGRPSGRLAEGLWGDITIWEQHPGERLVHRDLAGLQVMATIVGGRLVYRKA